MQKALKQDSGFKKTTEKGKDGPTARLERREKTPVSENRPLAIRVAAIAAVFVLVVMGPLKLKGLKNEARDVFRNGTNSRFAISVYNDIHTAADNAVTFAGLAESVLTQNDADAKKLRALSETIRDTEDEAKLLSAFAELKVVTEDLYTRFENAKPDENAAKQAYSCYKNIKSAYETVSKDGYFTLAHNFNEARGGFPANLMALIGGIGSLPEGVK